MARINILVFLGHFELSGTAAMRRFGPRPSSTRVLQEQEHAGAEKQCCELIRSPILEIKQSTCAPRFLFLLPWEVHLPMSHSCGRPHFHRDLPVSLLPAVYRTRNPQPGCPMTPDLCRTPINRGGPLKSSLNPHKGNRRLSLSPSLETR